MMAKNIRRMLAMIMVLCMCVSAVPLQALAAEDESLTATDTITGGEVVITFTPSGENSSTVAVSGTNESGAEVKLDGNTTTNTTTVTDSNGTVTETTTKEVALTGTEKDGNIEKSVEYAEITTDITITKADGTVTEKTATDGSEKKAYLTTEDNKGDSSVTVGLIPGQTTTGTAKVEGTETSQSTTQADGTVVIEKEYEIDRTVDATASESEIIVESTGSGAFTPIQTDRNMIYVEENQLHTHEKTSYKQTSNPNTAMNDKPEDEQYDFLFIGQGQMSDFYVGTIHPDGEKAHSGALQFELLYDPAVENGKYVKNAEDLFTAYCVDLTTGAQAGWWYKMDNLEDAGYYDEAAAAQIRSIVSTGYWGTNPGEDENDPATGSLEKLKQTMKNAGNTGLTDEEIDQLTPGQALAATQAAIWSYANAETGGAMVNENELIKKGYKQDVGPTEDDYKKAMAVYTYLRNLTPSEKSESTDIIDRESFIQEDSMSITVGDKIADAAENADNDHDNDVYDVAVNFALVVTPTANDDLVVQVVRIDANGETIVAAQGRIAGSDENDDGFNEVTYDKETGTYSLKNLQLAENSDFSFDLKLVGTQYLQQGVYIFNSEVRNGATSQTFVGMAEGHKEVNVKQNFVISFDVDENNYVVEETIWHYDNDPAYYPDEPTPYGEEPVPQVFHLENEEDVETIPEEEVPLAAAPVTGDLSNLWVTLILAAAFGLFILNITGKKRGNAAF